MTPHLAEKCRQYDPEDDVQDPRPGWMTHDSHLLVDLFVTGSVPREKPGTADGDDLSDFCVIAPSQTLRTARGTIIQELTPRLETVLIRGTRLHLPTIMNTIDEVCSVSGGLRDEHDLAQIASYADKELFSHLGLREEMWIIFEPFALPHHLSQA